MYEDPLKPLSTRTVTKRGEMTGIALYSPQPRHSLSDSRFSIINSRSSLIVKYFSEEHLHINYLNALSGKRVAILWRRPAPWDNHVTGAGRHFVSHNSQRQESGSESPFRQEVQLQLQYSISTIEQMTDSFYMADNHSAKPPDDS